MFQYLNVVAENIHFIALKGPLQGGMAHVTVQEISSHWDLDLQR